MACGFFLRNYKGRLARMLCRRVFCTRMVVLSECRSEATVSRCCAKIACSTGLCFALPSCIAGVPGLTWPWHLCRYPGYISRIFTCVRNWSTDPRSYVFHMCNDGQTVRDIFRPPTLQSHCRFCSIVYILILWIIVVCSLSRVEEWVLRNLVLTVGKYSNRKL